VFDVAPDDEGATMPAQPPDEWTYLRPEEFADDDAVERVDAEFETNAEVAALHLVDADEPPAAGLALDPGETIARPGVSDEGATRYFDDEEPEVGATEPDHDRDTDDAAEPAVDEILVSQHYAFDEESP